MLEKKPKIIITVLLLFCYQHFFAQEVVVVSYDEKIDFGNFDSHTHFDISGMDHTKVKGNQINQYVFAKPGDYQIKVSGKKSGDHCESHSAETINVKVSRIRMTFDNEKMLLSESIVKNEDTKGISLTIPVHIETKDHLPALLKFTTVNVAGIGSGITAQLDSQLKELPEGKHLLHYTLSGIATENAFLMFDFIDANGKIQSVPLVTPVKN